MRVRCVCYKNTGFNKTDIPDSPALLEKCEKITITDGIFKRQDKYLASVKLPLTWEQVQNVDYVCVDNTYYWVNSITMKSEHTAFLSITEDALTTLGGPAGLTWTGWCTRRCVTDDTLFSNNIEEPFKTHQEWVISSTVTIGGEEMATTLNLVGSTIELAGSNSLSNTKQATTYSDKTTGNTVVVPRTTPTRKTKSCFYLAEDLGLDYREPLYIPAVNFYDGDNDEVRESIAEARSLGADSSIIYSYMVPMCYIGGDTSEGGFLNNIKGVFRSVDTKIPFIWDDSVKNKKCFSKQFYKFCLMSVSSGASEIYGSSEIYANTDTAIFAYFSDPSPEGRPYYRPRAYEGNYANWFLKSVAGSSWQNAPIAYESKSGISIDIANMSMSHNLQAQNLQMTQAAGWENIAIRESTRMAGAIGAAVINPFISLPSLATEAAGVAGEALTQGVNNVLQQELQRSEQKQQTNSLNLTAVTQPVQLSFPMTPSLQNYTRNGAIVFAQHISSSDIKRLDNFLTAFGYAVNEPLTGGCFSGRKNFNYVQGVGDIISKTEDINTRQAAASQVANGVRVWHVIPSASALYDNPIGG